MGELVLILVGATLATLGWYWGGLTDSRTSAIGTGAAAAVLGGVAIFAAAGQPSVPIWALAATSAVFGGLATATVRAEVGGERTLGLYSLFWFLAAALSGLAASREAVGAFGVGALLTALAAVLVFVSGALIPTVRGFRSFAGWVVLVLGAAIAAVGFGPPFGVLT